MDERIERQKQKERALSKYQLLQSILKFRIIIKKMNTDFELM